MCFVCFVGKKSKNNDLPFAYHTELELEIITLTNHGVGLARVPLPSSQPSTFHSQLTTQAPAAAGAWVVMVPFCLPGERVRARIFRNHKNYSEADLIAVLTPSPHRIAPVCPLFTRCGGCQYQHFTYSEQLLWKQRQVAELLQHMAGITHAVNPVIGSPKPYGYRSKITPHFNPPRQPFGLEPRAESPEPDSGSASSYSDLSNLNSQLSARAAAAVPIGFLRQGTRFDIVDVPRCYIATDAINEKLPESRAKIHTRAAAGEFLRGSTLLLRDADGQVTTDYEAIVTETVAPLSDAQLSALRSPPLSAPPTFDVQSSKFEVPREPAARPSSASVPQLSTFNSQPAAASPLRLRFLARDFFQNNPFILPAFTAYVRAQAAASGARFLVDAYCGSGLFALSAAPSFERVAGIELSESSIRFARQNATANNIANATFQSGDAATIFAGLPALVTPESPKAFTPAETAVIIDPPRKGCDESFLTQLFAFAPRTVVYVSCDPATQMRDLKSFLAAGYTLTDVQPFDLFPQTRHLECVITLVNSLSTA